MMLELAVCIRSQETAGAVERILEREKESRFCYEIFLSPQGMLQFMDRNAAVYPAYLLDADEQSALCLAAAIRKRDPKGILFFLTGREGDINRILELQVSRYLRKESLETQIVPFLRRVDAGLQAQKRFFCYSFRKNQFRLECEDILYLWTCRKKLYLKTGRGEASCYMRMEEALSQLSETQFVRVNCSCTVNREAVSAVIRGEVWMKDGCRFMISRPYKNRVHLVG